MLNSLIGFLLITTPVVAAAPTQTHHSSAKHQHISADQIKAWLDMKKDFVILDARSKPYFDGTLIQNAKWIPMDAPDSDVKAAIPSKTTTVVVYCAGPKCPASGMLYNRLHSMGYTNVFEFHEGLEEWINKGYLTTKQ